MPARTKEQQEQREQEQEAAYGMLAAAVDKYGADCKDIDLFTADELSSEDAVVLGQICDRCPLATLCRAYADIAKPTAGYWAGNGFWAGRNHRRTHRPRGVMTDDVG